MIWTITKKNVMKHIASFLRDEDKKPLGVSMPNIENRIREPWNKKHLDRIHRTVNTLRKKGFIYLDEPDDKSLPVKYFPTPEGLAWLKVT